MMGVLISGYLVFPQIFSAPSGKTMCRTHESFGVMGTYSTCSITYTFTDAKFGGYRNSPAAGAAKNVEVSCLFVTLLNVRVCAPDFAMKA